jgi:hypothetical protein
LGQDAALRIDIVGGHERIAHAIVRGNAPEAARLAAAAMDDIIGRLERAFPGFLDQPVDWQ